VALVAVLAYPLSFGPVCWLVGRGFLPMRPTVVVYTPILENLHKVPGGVVECITLGDLDTLIGLVQLKLALNPEYEYRATEFP
jgi:hypothetical protein